MIDYNLLGKIVKIAQSDVNTNDLSRYMSQPDGPGVHGHTANQGTGLAGLVTDLAARIAGYTSAAKTLWHGGKFLRSTGKAIVPAKLTEFKTILPNLRRPISSVKTYLKAHPDVDASMMKELGKTGKWLALFLGIPVIREYLLRAHMHPEDRWPDNVK